LKTDDVKIFADIDFKPKRNENKVILGTKIEIEGKWFDITSKPEEWPLWKDNVAVDYKCLDSDSKYLFVELQLTDYFLGHE